MTRSGVRSSKGRFIGLLIVVFALLTSACGGEENGEDTTTNASDLSGTIRIDGSSTVAPLSEAAAELFRRENSNVQITVGTSGTGGGFEKFCNGETDISDASRPIKDEEIELCRQNGVEYGELQVANDGISVVVNPENDWVECLTVEQLKKIWDEGSTVKNWKDVDPSFPDEEIALFGPGTDSGTFDYFTEAINGEEGRSRTDYNATEDDNVTVQGVAGSKGAIGYFGLSYLEQNEGKVKAVETDNGDGCVAPTTETVQEGTYKPLSRPLFIYPTKQLLERPEGSAFVEYYIDNTGPITERTLFVDLTDEQKTKAKEQLEELKPS